jgi:cation diffusion facilitator CzcD-associated flavoprotein CzcO
VVSKQSLDSPTSYLHCESDVPAIFYSFSFCPNPKWTSFHPEGPEIVKYLQGVCDHYEIVDKVQLNTDVRECKWLESEKVWEVTDHGPESIYVHQETVRAKVLISAVGGLVEPKTWPEGIQGKEKFQGEIFHSARWRYDVDLKDKEVIVVGTGCSAAQFVPRLTREYGAKSVTQLMRSPPWIIPRVLPPFGTKNWEKWAPWLNTNIPGFAKTIRMIVFLGAEYVCSIVALFPSQHFATPNSPLSITDAELVGLATLRV